MIHAFITRSGWVDVIGPEARNDFTRRACVIWKGGYLISMAGGHCTPDDASKIADEILECGIAIRDARTMSLNEKIQSCRETARILKKIGSPEASAREYENARELLFALIDHGRENSIEIAGDQS